MRKTAFGEAFDRAGRDTAGDRLYVLATECLRRRRNGGAAAAVAARFDAEVRADPALLAALLGDEDILKAAHGYLERVAGDMDGTSAHAPQRNVQ